MLEKSDIDRDGTVSYKEPLGCSIEKLCFEDLFPFGPFSSQWLAKLQVGQDDAKWRGSGPLAWKTMQNEVACKTVDWETWLCDSEDPIPHKSFQNWSALNLNHHINSTSNRLSSLSPKEKPKGQKLMPSVSQSMLGLFESLWFYTDNPRYYKSMGQFLFFKMFLKCAPNVTSSKGARGSRIKTLQLCNSATFCWTMCWPRHFGVLCISIPRRHIVVRISIGPFVHL